MTNNFTGQGEGTSLVDEWPMAEDPKSKQDVKEQALAECEHDKLNNEDAKDVLPKEKVEISLEEKLANELAQTKDRLLRLAADFENFKKISSREQLNSVKFANEGLITSLLPVMDNLEQAVFACKKSSEGNNDVLIGVEMVLKQLVEAMKKWGVEVFSAEGQPFDPARHEAVGEKEDDNVPAGSVVAEYQKGYLLNGRLLRPARVMVAKKSGN